MIDPLLPLIDLHHHLDGSVRVSTILDLGRKYDLPLPAWTLRRLKSFVQVTDPEPDILSFFEKFKWQTIGLVDTDACRRVAYENVEDAKREGLDYVELRFSPIFMAEAHRLRPAAVVEAVVDGVRAGERDFNLRANVIGIISRTYGATTGLKELEALLNFKDQIVGLDLAGDEVHYPGSLFIEHFRLARDVGWHITVHAGEMVGPESIWQALQELGAERIGHAVHAPEDPVLMKYLWEHHIPVESNLTSNVQTSTVKDYQSHPLRRFMEQGIPATINTDDPGVSDITLHFEYEMAEQKAGLTPQMIHTAQMNALHAAFLNDAEKSTLLEKAQNRKTDNTQREIK
jgi:adenosine deaminase